MKKTFCIASGLILLFICASISSIAQQNTKKISFPLKSGKYSIEQFAANIFKITCKPVDYTTNENPSNAVLLKPVNLTISLSDIKASADSFTVVKWPFLNNFTFHEDKNSNGFRFTIEPDEMIFGGGERALPLNRRGYRFNLYNNPWYGYGEGADNLNYSVPFFISSKGYGVFFDNASKGYADIGKTKSDVFEAGFMSGELNVYVITGKDEKEILQSYQKLTGTQPLPPRWAMGNLMSRFGYTSQKQAESIVSTMQKEKIPFDAIIFDLFWFGDSIKGTMGNLDWVNTKKWSNPNAMIANFKKQNLQTILIAEPFVLEGTKGFEASAPFLAKNNTGKPFMIKDFYFGVGGLIDIFRKDAGDWIWNYHYKKQINNGVAAWWTDLGEPEKHPSDMLHNLKDLGISRSLKADEVHNIYGHYWNKMLFENYAKDYPEARLFHLNRSGFAGSPRYSIFPWSGDVSRSWKGLNAQVSLMLGMSMSGVPYIHADAGGFAGGEGDNELYIRWLQFASYTPVFRPHGTALYEVDKNAFSFPSEPALFENPYKSIARGIVEERYRMLPYNYTLCYRQAKYGEPLVAPLLYHFKNDENLLTVNDEFMWGEHVLVAPVLEKDAEIRAVYLPANNWYNAATNTMYKGNHRAMKYKVRDFAFPVFYKEGSFIPKYNSAATTADIDRSALEITYVPSATASSYEMYDDDGESKNAIQQKEFELIHFSSTGKSGSSLAITVKSSNTSYKGKPINRNINFIIPAIAKKPSKVVVNGIKIDATEKPSTYNAEKSILMIPVVLNNQPVKIEVKW